MDLQSLPFIQTVGTSNTWKHWAKGSGVAVDITPNLFADTYGLTVDFAKNGAGAAIVSSLIAAPCLESGSLTQIHSASVEPIDGYYLATNNKPDDKPVTDFTQWLHAQVKTITSH